MRNIKCARLGRELPGLEKPPFGGPIGQEIYERVSAEAWGEWVEMQIKIVNEYRLDLSEKDDRERLNREMRSFLKLDED